MAIHSECSSAETGEVRFIHSYLALIQLAIATDREYTRRRLLWLLLGLLGNFDMDSHRRYDRTLVCPK